MARVRASADSALVRVRAIVRLKVKAAVVTVTVNANGWATPTDRGKVMDKARARGPAMVEDRAADVADAEPQFGVKR